MPVPEGMDRICLHGLQVKAVIGVFGWEREAQQTLILDLDLGVDISAAARSDDIKDAVDYKAVSREVVHFTRQSRYRLVESLAEAIAQLILDQFKVSWLRVKINKRWALRNVHDVGIIIERRRTS